MNNENITIKTESGSIIEITDEDYNRLKDYTLDEIIDRYNIEDAE